MPGAPQPVFVCICWTREIQITDPKDILKRYFGYDEFRPNQAELVGAILAGRDVLAVMPTGAGKSLCYQVPALCLDGVALVISPLIALMEDQVGALLQMGVQAACIHSAQTPASQRTAFEAAREGKLKLLYVAPERLHAPSFVDFARNCPLALVAVDEAHCISQWGQDFRPSYTRINAFVGELPSRPPVCAFTATATQRVSDDIERKLALRDPLRIRASFDRPNLKFSTRNFAGAGQKAKDGALLRFLKQHEGQSGIVYCTTRNVVDEVCELLRGNGYAAVRYHGGVPDAERATSQADFVYDRVPIVVATNAFGMGIDKSNVGFVVHYNMPLDVESYYQEAGRAGRDGSPADCVLFYAPKDVSTARFLLSAGLEENAHIDGPTLRILRDAAEDRLRQMTFYCTTNDCLRGFLLRYFGETPPLYCGNCSNCLQKYDERDVTTEARKIISCVARLAQRNRTVGKTTIVGILRGSRADKIMAQDYDTLSTYGIMADATAHEVRYILDALIERGMLEASLGDYPVVSLNDASLAFLRSDDTFVLKVPQRSKAEAEKARLHDVLATVHGEVGSGAAGGGTGRTFAGKAGDPYANVPVDPDLFQALRELRARLASEQGVPAYVVFHDKTLAALCRRQPRTVEELLEVPGIGVAKADRYGEAVLQVLNGTA